MKVSRLILLSLIPILVNIFAVSCLLPDTVALHVGIDGADRYGSKFETFVIGGLFTGCNLPFTLLYVKAEKLNEHGLIHGTDVRGARVCLLGVIIVFDMLAVATLFMLKTLT